MAEPESGQSFVTPTLTDDGKDYTYVWDAFYRLRKIKERGTGDLVAELKYNGLGHRISFHEDTDEDGDVDGNDLWYNRAYDEHSRWIASYRDDDPDPKEEYLHECSGLGGFAGSSFIDGLVYRDRDADTNWTTQSDGSLEERLYACQNLRGDMTALVTRSGQIVECTRYSAYGLPFGLPGGDGDSDGDCDANDESALQGWISGSAYDVRGDVNLDGSVDSADESQLSSDYIGITSGWGIVSSESTANVRGACSTLWTQAHGGYHVRAREASPSLGAWYSRDPLLPKPGSSLYEMLSSNPLRYIDPMGTSPTSADKREALKSPCVSNWISPNPQRLVLFQDPTSPNGLGLFESQWILDFHSTFQSNKANIPFGTASCSSCTWTQVWGFQPKYMTNYPGCQVTTFETLDAPQTAIQCMSTCGHLTDALYYYWHGEQSPGCHLAQGQTPPLGTPGPTWTPPTGATFPIPCDGSSVCYVNRHVTTYSSKFAEETWTATAWIKSPTVFSVSRQREYHCGCCP